MALLSYGVGMVPILLEATATNDDIIQVSNGLLLGSILFLALPESLEIFIKTDHNLRWISITMVVGFLTMYYLEKYNHAHNVADEVNGEYESLSWLQLMQSIVRNTLVFILIFHSIIDGIALGSSFHNDDISLLFALIIIIHKLPTCFSLSGLLVDSNIDFKLIRLYIGIFSLTTPLISVIIWLALYLININDFIISLLLLLSLGTFLNLLMQMNQPVNVKQGIILTIGITIPLLLSFLAD